MKMKKRSSTPAESFGSPWYCGRAMLRAALCSLLLVSMMSCEHKLPVPIAEELCSPSDFAPFDKAPIIIEQVQPQYPETARQDSLEGTVLVKVLIDRKGRVQQVEIITSDAEIFNQPALDAAKQWLFIPAMFQGQPICILVSNPFHFKP